MTEPIVTVAVDAMGGDHAPAAVVEGVTAALAADPQLVVLLVGPEDVVIPHASERCRPVVATEVIDMGEHPARAVRAKRDSSIVVASRLVKDGSADAFFSAGSTGACMAAATLVMGRITGVIRPALATVIPSSTNPCVLLDVGANADVKPEMLVQFAAMGRAYASVVLGVAEPSTALLNIGEEPTKGSQLVQEAFALLSTQTPGFIGNVEGRDIVWGVADVIVTDGFTGNVALKAIEGLASMLFTEMKRALTATVARRLAAVVVGPVVRELRSQIDPDAYGGAPLLGVSGVCIIGHGRSNARAVRNGIGVAVRAARGGLTARITDGLQRQAADA